MKAPQGLRAPGKRLWAQITAGLDLEPREVAVLELACRQTDELALLEAEVRSDGMTVEGSMGQTRVNGGLAELRQARLAVARLLGQIDIPAVAEESSGTRSSAQQRAAHAAKSRWAAEARRKARDGAAA